MIHIISNCVTLLNRTWNYESVMIEYNLITNNMYISIFYHKKYNKRYVILFDKTWDNIRVTIKYNQYTNNIYKMVRRVDKPKYIKRRRNYGRKYCKSEHGKQVRKKYRKSIRGKEIYKKAWRKYNKSKKHIDANKRYYKTKKGSKIKKIIASKSSAKRKQGLEWNKLYNNPFDDFVDIEWHHVNNSDVVALPKWLHQRFNGHSRHVHRELLRPFVKQIYERYDVK